MKTLTEYLESLKERVSKTDNGCYCGLPGCDDCEASRLFEYHSYDDVKILLEIIEKLIEQRDSRTNAYYSVKGFKSEQIKEIIYSSNRQLLSIINKGAKG